ncbi:YfcL family protein [Shewanella intestini]|uniref:YfcL family protein n=1 Tax=Shewanella intestini TaxID=2017544 RepID=A0ABS5I256_9GAMM|nr:MULTISPECIES: YfcL family protein [Shewanella]MBR9727480.1 YfcL family protein [Shewanella intestini]MRG35470.1 YfcL family protein [Shewanella sp. XMDDZSB0408]
MLEQIDVAVESWIEEAVSHGDDDALFCSGYLQGHIAVVLAELEAEQQATLSALDDKMIGCLALANDELNEGDYLLVANAWQQLRQRIATL